MPDVGTGVGRKFSRLAVNGLAAAWGFVILILHGQTRSLVACLWALAGALLGGLVMYSWGATRLSSAENVLVRLPAVDQPMLAEVHRQIERSGYAALFAGPLAGRPYKIYAVYAGALGLSVWGFLLVSIPARLLRFVLLAGLTHLVARRVLSPLSVRWRQVVFCICWVSFYAWFFLGN